MTASEIDRSERLHGLDALRAAALLLGVVLHATLSFFPTPIWIVADDQRSVVGDELGEQREHEQGEEDPERPPAALVGLEIV